MGLAISGTGLILFGCVVFIYVVLERDTEDMSGIIAFIICVLLAAIPVGLIIALWQAVT